MRVFTDGSCTSNGQKGAKAGYAAWFPEHPEWSESHRVPDDEAQTNNRAELRAIALAVDILEIKGCLDQDVVIYSDSKYSIDCLTKWITGWTARGWKTANGKDVQHRDLIEETAKKLSKFRTHAVRYVPAHTGGTDDLSRQNDVADRMANESVTGKKIAVVNVPSDEIAAGCPLTTLGTSVRQDVLVDWIRGNLSTMDKTIVDKHLYKAFAEVCKGKNLELSKHKQGGHTVIKATLETVFIEKVE
uniref:ribonuclease H n=1 Tax=viral metagenome TaxID=1070528 RepID=A0A6C0J791_9ZZZZ